MFIIDGHNDTLTRRFERDGGSVTPFLEGTPDGQLDLPRALSGGLSAAFFAIFTPPPPGHPERDPMHGLTFTEQGYMVTERQPIDPTYARTYTDAVLEYAWRLESASAGRVRIITETSELQPRTDSLGLILHLEGAEAIAANLSNLDDLYQNGVRSIGPVWSRPNVFGYGVPFHFPHSPDIGQGLTNAGRELIEACHHLGIMVDLSHLNEQGFRDVAAMNLSPLVVTHADVFAISPSTRNLTDAQIDAVGRSGGVIGINFETLNTHPLSSIESAVPLTQITQHIDYIVKRIGVDHVAFGSDFDGADMPDDLKDAAHLPNLIQQLEAKGYTSEEIEKMAAGNWVRVLKDTWKK